MLNVFGTISSVGRTYHDESLAIRGDRRRLTLAADEGSNHQDCDRDQHDREPRVHAGNIASPGRGAPCHSKAQGTQRNPDQNATDQTRASTST
jgi:hypothetical protein